MVDDDSGVGDGGEGCESVGETAAVRLLQDVLTNHIGVVDVAGELAAVHHLGFIVTHPRPGITMMSR